MDVELLKIWHKGLQASREKVLDKQQESDVTFKEKLRRAKQAGAGKADKEQSGAQLTLLDMYSKELERRPSQKRLKRRAQRRKELERAAEAAATQRIRSIKAANFARAAMKSNS